MLLAFLGELKQQVDNYHHSTTDNNRITPLHGSILISELMDFYESYKKVNSFVEVVNHLSPLNKEFCYGNANLKNGMYLRALCVGISDIENLYVDDFGKLERAVLLNDGIPEIAFSVFGGFLFWRKFISHVHGVYKQLLRMISAIVQYKFHGCQILDLCLKFKLFLPDEIFYLLLNYVNKPLLNQITSWIVFGELEDPREEFFIKRIHSNDNTNTNDNHTVCSDQLFADTAVASSSSSTPEIQEDLHEIESDYLPLHVPFSLAEKILSTGRLMSLLQSTHYNSSTSSLYQSGEFGINQEDIMKAMQQLEKQDNFDFSDVEKVVHLVWNAINKVK